MANYRDLTDEPDFEIDEELQGLLGGALGQITTTWAEEES